jgi:hypothetical protein
MTKKLLATAVAVSALAAPTAAQAQTPTSTDQKNAAKQCKAMRQAAGSAELFRASLPTAITGKVTVKNAYGKCVSFYAKDEAEERSTAQKQAVRNCKAEREAATTDAQKAAFAQKYGARNTSSAYGKCVSQSAKANKAEEDQEDADRVNAAKQCKTERGTTSQSRADFARKYRNFGKCVSQKAHEANEARRAEREQD